MKPTTPPRAPIIGEYVRTAGRLLEIVQPPPPPPPIETAVLVFEYQNARIDLTRNGRVLNRLAGITDYCGEGTAVKTAIKEAQEYCRKEHVTAASEVTVVVTKVEERRYYKRDNGSEGLFGAREFESIREVSRPAGIPRPEPVETVVWTSRDPKALDV